MEVGDRIDFRALLRSWAQLAYVAAACVLVLLSCSRSLSSVPSINATATGTTLYLTWNVVYGASQYEVYLSHSSSVSPMSYTTEYSSDTTNLAIPGLTLGSTYYLVIAPIAFGGMVRGPTSKVVEVPINGYLVSTIAGTASGTTLNLTWTPIGGVSQYVIYLSQSSSVSPSNYTSTYTSSTAGYSIPGLTVGATYYFVIVPTDSSGTAVGPASSVTSVVVGGYQVSSLTATPNGGTISLSWVGNSSVPQYAIYLSQSSSVSPSSYTNTYTSSTTSYTISGLAVGATYYLVVVSTDSSGTAVGPASSAVSVDMNGYVYASNGNGTTGKLGALALGSGGGLLPVNGSPFNTGTTTTPGKLPLGVAVSPDNNLVYVANGSSASISAFSVGTDGTLTSVTGSPFTSGGVNAPHGLAVTPNGGYLYAANDGNNTISGYSVASNGSLAALSGSPFPATGTGTSYVAITPDSNYLYAVDFSSNQVEAFQINSTTGALSAIGSPAATQNGPWADAVTPDEKYLYISNSTSNSITAFHISSGGTLGSSTTYSSGGLSNPNGLAVSPDGKYLYVANASSSAGSISGYSIGTGGTLTALPGSPFSVGGTYPVEVAVTHDSQYVYSVNDDGTVKAFAIGSTTSSSPGALTAVNNGTALAGNGGWGIAASH